MKRRARLTAALLSISAAFSVFSLHTQAETAEDVFQALSDIGMPPEFVTDVRNQYRKQPHDENGMYMNGEYHTYDEWVQIIHDNDAAYIWAAVAEYMCVPVEDIIEYYNKKAQNTAPENGDTTVTEPAYEPSVKPEKPFIEMTLEEKRAFIQSLPEEERAEFLANLSPEERNSILKELDPEKKQEILEGLIDLGQQMGMTVTVDDTENFRFSVRDQKGNLIDSTGFGLTVDPTGWNTTLPVLGGSCMILLAAGGLITMVHQNRKQKEHSDE